jgi:hypothetical protein
MSASRTAVKLGIVAVSITLFGALLLGAVGRVRDASDRAT